MEGRGNLEIASRRVGVGKMSEGEIVCPRNVVVLTPKEKLAVFV